MRAREALAVALLIVALAACSPGGDALVGSPLSAPGPTSEPVPTPQRSDAPAPPRALDVRGIAADPCGTLFSAADARAIGLRGPGTERASLGATRCRWDARRVESVTVSVHPDRDLLGDTYRARLDPVFVPTTVDGFPAVRQKSGQGELNICTVTTGVGPRQALDVRWVATGDPAPGNDACEFAEQATALVIAKLPPAD